jgi:hypothetical protein
LNQLLPMEAKQKRIASGNIILQKIGN